MIRDMTLHGKACEVIAVLCEYAEFSAWWENLKARDQLTVIEELIAVLKNKE